MITHKDLEIGEWKDVSKPYHKPYKYLELRAKNMNKCLGKASIRPLYNIHVKAMFSLETDSGGLDIPFTKDINTIHKAWSEDMDRLLSKLFK